MMTNGKSIVTLSVIGGFVLWAGGLAFALDQQKEMGNTPTASSGELLLNANTLIGNHVVDHSGKELGTVKDFLIDQKTGRIEYIILAYGGTFGGTLGINQENFSIPWKQVTLTRNHDDQTMTIQVANVPIRESKDTAQVSRANDKKAFHTNEPITIKGKVEGVESEVVDGVSLKVLEVKTASTKERVRLAPVEYISKENVEIAQGDDVEIEGVRTTEDNESLILASTVKLNKSGKVFALREKDGTPKWKHEKGIATQSKDR